MKTQDIRSMGLAYLEVLEGKNAVNKHGHDHVGKEDDDVDNDKEVDSTDKYLLNRRKAISANIRKEEVEEVDEALAGNQHKIDANKNGKVDAHDFKLLRRKKTQTEEVDLDEAKLSPEKQERLDSLISNVMMTTDPSYYGNDTPQKYLKAIEKEFGATIAKQVDDGSYKTHWGRDNQAHGHDKLESRQWSSKFKGGPRVTAAGKMNKQDVSALKNRIKGDKRFGGLSKSVKLPEETELDEVSANTLGKYSIKAAQQGGSDKRVAGQKMADEKIRKKQGYSSDAKVAAEATEWPIFARIQEKADKNTIKYSVSGIGDDPHEITMKFADAKHTKGATKAEPIDSTASQGEKDFIAMHGGLTGNDSGHSTVKNSVTNAAAVRNSVKQAPGRPGDQKIGDKTPPKASA